MDCEAGQAVNCPLDAGGIRESRDLDDRCPDARGRDGRACLNGAASAAQRAPDASLAFVFPSVFFFPVTG